MIVTSQSAVDTQQTRENKKEARKSSERFARLLDSHAKQQHDSDQLVRRAEKQQAFKAQQASAARPRAVTNATGNPSDSPQRNIDSIAATDAPRAPEQLHKLANELGQQIDFQLSRGGVRGVDITFHSRTLAGLQVQIRQVQGQLSIRFVSQSTLTARLLSLHASTLKESLEDKGFKISGIAIDSSRSGPRFGRRDVEA